MHRGGLEHGLMQVPALERKQHPFVLPDEISRRDCLIGVHASPRERDIAEREKVPVSKSPWTHRET